MKTSGEWSEDKKKTKSEPNTKLWKEKKRKQTESESGTHNQPSMWPMTGQLLCYSDSRVHSAYTFVPISFHSISLLCFFFCVHSIPQWLYSRHVLCLVYYYLRAFFFFLELMPLVVISVHPGTKETSENKTTNRWKREREREKIYSSIECKCAFLWICTRSRRT